MKKLKFVMKNNGNIIYNEKVDFECVDEYLKFTVANFIIKLQYTKKKFMFIKESDEDIFEINFDNNNIVSRISSKNPAITFDINLEDFRYKFNDKYIFFSYKIDSDENFEVSVMITF